MTQPNPAPSADALLELISTRRSVSRVLPDCPPKSVIEAILRVATFAPNHHHTHPWRFLVLAGDARARAGQSLARSLTRSLSDPDTTENRLAITREGDKFLRAPVIIAAAVEPSTATSTDLAEEIAAGAAGVQNVLLAAHAFGLGAVWRTGSASRDPIVVHELGFRVGSVLTGFVYVGIPVPNQAIRPRPERPHLAAITRWDGWDAD